MSTETDESEICSNVNVTETRTVSRQEETETSFNSSYESTKGAADLTLQQLASAKESFTDLEATYQKFKVELESVREEHRVAVCKLSTQIENLTKQKSSLEEQLKDSKGETKKYQEDLLNSKRQLAETEWEKESIGRELNSSKSIIEKLKGEKEILEKEINALRSEVKSSTHVTTVTTEEGLVDGEADAEFEKLKNSYTLVVQEKETLQTEMDSLQTRFAELQADYEKAQTDLHSHSKNSTVKVSKAELQVTNIGKQKESLQSQLDSTREELKKSKESYRVLQKEMLDYQQKTATFKEELAAKTRQVETLSGNNKDLEAKLESMKLQYSKQQMSTELLATSKDAYNKDIRASQTKVQELEAALRSSRAEKDDIQRGMFLTSSKLTNVEESYQRTLEKNKELERQIAAARDTTARLESELFAQRSKNSQLDSLSSQMKIEINELVTQIDDVNSRYVKLQSTCEHAAHERDEYRERTSLSDRKVSELSNLLQKAEDNNNELEQKMNTLKSQMWKLEGQAESNSRQKSQLKIELDEERTKTAKLKKELVIAQSRHSEFQRSMSWYKRESESKEKASDELKKAMSSYDQKIEDFYEEIGKLQAKLEIAEEEKREFHDQALQAQKRVKEVEADNKLCDGERDRLNAEVQGFYKRISEIQANNNVCEQEKNDLHHQSMMLEQKVKKYEAEQEQWVKLKANLELQINEINSSSNKTTDEFMVFKNQFDEQQHLIEEYRTDINEKNAEIECLKEKVLVKVVETEVSQGELKHFKSLYEDSEREKRSVSDKLIEMSEKLSRVNVQCEAAIKRKEQLEKDVAAADKKIMSLESSSKKSPDANLVKELEYERARLAESQRHLTTYKRKFQALQSETEISKKDIHGVADELEQAEDTIANLRAEVERSVEERNAEIQKASSLQRVVEELEKEAQAQVKEKEKSEDELFSMKTRVAKLESMIETLHKQRTHSKEQLHSINDKVVSYKEQIMRLESKVSEEKKINESLNKVIVKKDEMVNDSLKKIRSSEHEVEKIRHEVMSYRISCEGLKVEKVENEKRFSAYQEQIRSMEKDLSELRDIKNTLDQDLNTQKFKATSFEGQIENVRKDSAHYKKEYENAQASIRKVREELIFAKNKLREKERINEACLMEISDKDGTIERLRSSKVALESELISVKSEMETMRYNFEHCQERVKELEFSLEEATMSISRLDATINSFNSEGDENDLSQSYETKYFEIEALYKQAQDRERALKQDIKDLKGKLMTTENDLKSSQQHSIELNHEINVLNRKVHEWETAKERFEREKKELKSEVATATSLICDLEVKYEYECCEKASFETQLEDFRKRGAKNREELLKLEQTINEQRLSLEVSNREVKEKEHYIGQLKDGKLFFEEQINTQKRSLDESYKENEKFRKELSSLQQEILTLRASGCEYEAKIKKSILEKDRIQVENHNYIMKISSFEEQIAELNREKDSLYENIEEWKTASNRYMTEGMDSEKLAADYQSKIGFLKVEISKKDTAIQDLRDSKVVVETDLEATRRKLKRVEGDCAGALDEKKELETHYKALLENNSVTASTTETEMKKVQEENVVLKRRLSELDHNFKISQEKEKELQGRIVEVSTEMSKWESKYNSINERKTQLETDIISMQNEFGPLKDVHETSVHQLDSAEVELQGSLNKISQLEIQLDKIGKSKAQLEYQHQQQVLKSNSLEEGLLKAQRKLQETRMQLEHKTGAAADKNAASLEQLSIEKKGLEKDVSLLRQELTDLRNVHNASRRAKDDMEKEVFKLKTEATELNLKLKSYQQENVELNQEIIMHQRKIAEKEGQAQSYVLEKNALKAKRDEANKQLTVSREENTILQREVVACKTTLDTYKREISDSNNESEKAKSANGLLQEQVTQFKLKLEDLRDNNEKAQRDANNLKLQIREKAAKIAENEHSIRMVKQENDKLQYELAACRSSVSEYKNYYNTSQKEVERLQLDVITLNKKISHFEARNMSLEGERDRYRNEYVTMKKATSDAKNKIDVLQHEKSRLQTEISVAQKKYSDLRVLSQPDGTKNSERENEVDVQFESMKTDYEVSSKRNQELSDELKELKILLSKCENELIEQEKSKSSIEYEVKKKTMKIDELEETLKHLQSREVEFREEINKWQTRFTSTEQELEAAKSKITRLDAYSTSYNEKIQSMTKEMSMLQQKALQGDSSASLIQKRLESQQKELEDSYKKISELEAIHETALQGRNAAIRETTTFKGKVNALEEEIALKKSEGKRLQDQIDDLKSQNVTLRKETSSLRMAISEQQQALDSNVRQSTDHKYSMEQVSTEKLIKENEIKQLREELSKVRDTYEKKNIEVRELNFEVQKAQLQVSEWEANYKLLKKDNDDMRRECDRMKESYLKSDTTEDSKAYKGYDADMSSLRLERDRLKNKVSNLEGQNISMKETYERTSVENIKLEKHVTELEHSMRTVEAEKKTLQRDIHIASSKIQSYESELEFIRNERHALKSELHDMRIKLSSLESAASTDEKIVYRREFTISSEQIKLQEKVKETEQELTASRKRVFELERQVKLETEKLKSSEAIRKTLEQNVNNMKKETTSYKKTIKELEETCEHSNNKTRELSHKVSILEQKMITGESTIPASERKLDLEFEVTTLRSRVAKLEVQLERACSERDDFRGKVEEFNEVERKLEMKYASELAMLRETNGEKDATIEKLYNERIKSEYAMENLRSRLASMQSEVERKLATKFESQMELLRQSNEEKGSTIENLYTERIKSEYAMESLKEKLIALQSGLERTMSSKGTVDLQNSRREIREKDNLIARLECDKLKLVTDIEQYRNDKDRLQQHIEILIRESREKESLTHHSASEMGISAQGVKQDAYFMGSQYESLRKEIREKDFVIDGLRSEKTRHLAEIEALRRRITDIQMENQRNFTISLERYTDGSTKEIKEKELVIKQLRDEKMRVEKEVQYLRQEVALQKSQSQKSISVELHSHTEQHRNEIMERDYQMMQLRAEKASFEKQLEALKREIQFAKSEQDKHVLIQIEQHKEGFRKELREKEYLIEKLRAEKTSFEGHIESLRRQITFAESEKEKNISVYVESQTAGLTKEIKEKEAIIGQLRAERGRFEATIASLRKETIEAREKGQKKVMLQLESYSDGYKREIQQKEQIIQQLYAERTTLQAELESQKREIFILQNDSHKTVSVEVAKHTEAFQSKIQALSADAFKYKAEIDTLKREISSSQSRNEYEINIQVEKKSEALKQKLRERDIVIGQLKTEISGYNHKISTLEREIEYKTTIIQGYATEIETLRSDRAKLETEVGSLKNEYSSLKVNNERTIAIQLQGQTDNHRKELMEKEYLIAQLRAEKASVDRQVESLREQIVMIESENERSMSLHVESHTESYKQEIREKEYAVERMRTEKSTMEKQIESLRNQIVFIKEENEKNINIYLESNAEGYKRQITEKETMIEQLRGERGRYEEQIQSLRQQIVEVRNEGQRNVTLQIESRTEGFRNEIKQKEVIIQQLYEEKSKLQSELENQRREILVIQSDSQRNVTIEVEKRVEMYRNEISEKESLITRQRSDVFKLQAEVETMKREVSILQTKREHEISVQVQTQIDSVRKEVKERETTIENLKVEIMSYKTQMEALKREAEYKSSIVIGYTTEIETLRADREKMESENRSLKNEVVIVKSEAEKKAMLQIQSSTESNRKELLEKEYQIGQLRLEIAGYEKQVESLKQEIVFVKSESEKTVSYQIESQTGSLQRELRQKEYLIEQLRAEKASFEKHVESLREQTIVIRSDYEKKIVEAKTQSESNLAIYLETNTAGFKREISEKEVLIEQLRGEIAKIEERCESFRQQIVLVKQESQKNVTIQMESQAEGYKRELMQKQTLISQLYSEKSELQSQIEGLRREVIVIREEGQKNVSLEVEKRLEVYRSEVIEKESIIQKLRSEGYQCQSKVDALQREMTMIQARSEQQVTLQIESKVESVRQDVREKEVAIHSLTAENSNLSTQIDALKREAEYKMTIIQGYTTEIEGLRSERVKLEAQINSLRSEMSTIKSESERTVILQVQGKTENFRKELMEKEYMITQLRSEKASFERQVESLREQIMVVESENEKNMSIHIESQTESYKHEVREKEYMIESLRTEKTTLERQIESLRNQIVMIKEENEKNINIYLESNAEGYKRQISEKEVMIEQLRGERERYESQIESFRQQIIEVRNEGERNITLQIESRTEGFRNEIKQKELIIQQLYEEKSKLQAEIEGQRKEMIIIQSNSQKNATIEVEKRVEIYRNEIMEKEKLIQQLRSEVFKFEGQVEASKREIASAHTKNEYTIAIEVERKSEEFRKEIRDREITIGNLRAEINGFQTQIHSLSRDIEYKTSAIQGYATQIEVLRDAKQKMEIEITSLKTEVSSIKAEGEKTLMIQIHEQTENNRREVIEKEYLITQLRSEKASLDRQVESLREQIQVTESENERNMSIHIESQTENYKQEIREKGYMIERLQTEKMTFENQIESLRNQIVVIKEENEKNLTLYVESNAEGYKREIKEKDYLIETLRSERVKFEKDIENLRNEVIVVRAEGEKNVHLQIESHAESFRKEIAQKESLIQELYSEKSKLQGEKESLRYEMMMSKTESERTVTVEVEKRVEVYRKEIMDKETEIQTLRSDVFKYESEIAFLKQEMYALEQKGEQNLSLQLEVQTESIKKDVRDKEFTIEGLRAEIEGLRREQRNSITVSEGYVVEIERLKKEIVNNHYDKFMIESAKSENESLKLRYDEINKEKDTLLKARFDLEQEVRSANEKMMTVQLQAKGEVQREIVEYQTKLSEAEQKYQMVLMEKKHTENEVQTKISMAIWEKQETITKLERETENLRQELEIVRRELSGKQSTSESYIAEITKLKQSVSEASFHNMDYEAMKMKYDNVCNEKDTLLKDKFAVDYELSVAKAKIQDLETSAKTITSSRQDVIIYQDKYAKLDSDYHQVLTEKSRLENEIETRVRQEVWEKQELIYCLEKQVRELKTSNDGYLRSNEEKNTLISELRMKIATLQSEIQKYKKEAFFGTTSTDSKSTELKMITETAPSYEIRTATKQQKEPVYCLTTSPTRSEKSTITGFTATSTPRSTLVSPSQKYTHVTATDITDVNTNLETEMTQSSSMMSGVGSTTVITKEETMPTEVTITTTEIETTSSCPEKITETSEVHSESAEAYSRSGIPLSQGAVQTSSTSSSSAEGGSRLSGYSYRYASGGVGHGSYSGRSYSSGSGSYRTSGYYSRGYSSTHGFPVTRKYY